jgi:hypothetical protein
MSEPKVRSLTKHVRNDQDRSHAKHGSAQAASAQSLPSLSRVQLTDEVSDAFDAHQMASRDEAKKTRGGVRSARLAVACPNDKT